MGSTEEKKHWKCLWRLSAFQGQAPKASCTMSLPLPGSFFWDWNFISICGNGVIACNKYKPRCLLDSLMSSLIESLYLPHNPAPSTIALVLVHRKQFSIEKVFCWGKERFKPISWVGPLSHVVLSYESHLRLCFWAWGFLILVRHTTVPVCCWGHSHGGHKPSESYPSSRKTSSTFKIWRCSGVEGIPRSDALRGDENEVLPLLEGPTTGSWSLEARGRLGQPWEGL